MKEIIARLEAGGHLSKEEWIRLIEGRTPELAEELAGKARTIREEIFGKEVYTRGLIEFTNICKNDCYYCGIRRSNGKADRYRLTPEEILACCRNGWQLGFCTFVLQGGEDPYFDDDTIEKIIRDIKAEFSECAITLSLGERSRESFQRFYDAGAERYLLRHETADKTHYESLHPAEMSYDHRMQCLMDLKEIGYQTGCGFMVGSPGQTAAHLAQDLIFIDQFRPQMVGIGPFIPQGDTPFAREKGGSLELTTYLLSLIRLMYPNVLLPATTALGTIDPLGREKGILAGANVVMPNLSPVATREKYALYDNKICTGEEAAECVGCLGRRMNSIGYQIVESRGDFKAWQAT